MDTGRDFHFVESHLKGYRLRKSNRQRLIESVFALWKYSWMENGQLLAQKRKDHYLFQLSFLSEPEAKRFEENFSQDGASQHLREFSLQEGSKDEYAPLGDLLPPKVMETLTERVSGDPDVAMQFVEGLVERDETHPGENYVFQLPEEVKEAYRHYLEKHKPS